MMDEAIAIVMAPKASPNYGIFSLTSHGLQVINVSVWSCVYCVELTLVLFLPRLVDKKAFTSMSKTHPSTCLRRMSFSTGIRKPRASL